MYINEMLKSGKICPSKSPYGALIFIILKLHSRGLRVIVDYCGLNVITIKDQYLLLLMINLMDCVVKAYWFTKFDLKNSYNLIHVAAGHE